MIKRDGIQLPKSNKKPLPEKFLGQWAKYPNRWEMRQSSAIEKQIEGKKETLRSALRSQQIRLGMQEKVAWGGWPGRVRLGYLNSCEGNRKKVIPDPERSPLVQSAFYYAAEGKYSLRGILVRLTKRGLMTRNGKPLTSASLWRILTDPFYCGMIRYKGQITLGRHQPLIDKATFDRVQRNLRKRRRNNSSDGPLRMSIPYFSSLEPIKPGN